MSLSGVNFSGLTSGIDTDSIVKQLIALDQKPITQLQTNQQNIQQQQTAINQLAAGVTALMSAAATLDNSDAFKAVTASSTDTTVATVTASAGAQTGSHSLQVTQLAQAQRLGSTTFSSQTTPFNVTGEFVVNGKAVSVNAGDSLQSISSKINGANAGVNATVVSPVAGSYRLVLSSTSTGTANNIQLADVGAGTVLSGTLGLVGGSEAVRNPIDGGMASSQFADSATSVGTLLGLKSPPQGTIQIGGVAVSLDLGIDSLSGIASKISVANIPGVSAQVAAVTDPTSGVVTQQLQIKGAGLSITDANNVLAAMGIMQQAPTDQVQQARDAKLTVDGMSITRATNSISDIISGVTINLLKDTGSPTAQLTVGSDTSGIKSNINGFVSQYNSLQKTVADLTSFDSQTMATGIMFGDATVNALMDSITQLATGAVPGVGSAASSLAQIGITLDATGQLNVDDTALTSALTKNLSEVSRLFQAAGSTTDSRVTYVTSTGKTQSSGSTGYSVDITQPATQASMTASVAHASNDNPISETLTFTGSGFGAYGRLVTIAPNTTLEALLSQLNSDSVFSQYATATSANSLLVLTAKQFGTAGNFTVVSNQAAGNSGANNNSGIGTVPISVSGLNVAGTINREPATGSGQFLTGSTGNAKTDGLQIRVNATVAGNYGSMTYSQGIADLIKNFAQSATDTVNGMLTQYSNELGDQYTEMGTEIQDMTAAMNQHETDLRTQFAAMETAITQVKAAAAGLSSLTTTTTA